MEFKLLVTIPIYEGYKLFHKRDQVLLQASCLYNCAMNYEDAVLFKTALISTEKTSEVERDIRITPNDEEDFKFYLQDYKFLETDDTKSKLYCSDGKYAVYSFYWLDRILCCEKHIPES